MNTHEFQKAAFEQGADSVTQKQAWSLFPSYVTEGYQAAKDVGGATYDTFRDSKDWGSFVHNLIRKGTDHVKAPLIEGVSSQNYGGLLKYTPGKGYERNYDNLSRVLSLGGPGDPLPMPENYNFIQRGLSSIGRSNAGQRWLNDSQHLDEKANTAFQDASHGVLGVDQDTGKLDVNYGRGANRMWGEAKDWMGKNKGLTFGIGALGLLGVGSMLRRKKKEEPTAPRVAAPGPQLPAPYAGREGYSFTKG